MDYHMCKCGFVCVEGQLAKTEGACPRCGFTTNVNSEKFSGKVNEKFRRVM